MKAGVLEKDLLNQISEQLASLKPMPAVFEQNYVKRLHGENVKTGKGRISFMLDRVPGGNESPAKALERATEAVRLPGDKEIGMNKSDHGSWTQWELARIGQAGILDQVDFYRYNRKHGEWRRVG